MVQSSCCCHKNQTTLSHLLSYGTRNGISCKAGTFLSTYYVKQCGALAKIKGYSVTPPRATGGPDTATTPDVKGNRHGPENLRKEAPASTGARMPMPMPKSPHVYFEYCRRYSIWLVLLRARCSCTRVSPARWRQGKINTQGLTGAHKTAKAPEYRRSCTSDNHPDPRRMAGRAGRAPFVSPKRRRILSAAVATKRRKVPYTSRASLVSSFWTEYPTTTKNERKR